MMTEKQAIEFELNKINQMSHEEMARFWRFAPGTHAYFDIKLPFFVEFKNRFKELGGMTPEISKKLGWGNDE